MIRRVLAAGLLSLVLAVPMLAQAQEEGVEVSANKSHLGVGARVRYVNVPNWLLNLFLDHATNLSSVGVGAEFVRRKGNFDVVFGFEWDSLSLTEGLFLDKGGTTSGCLPGDCPDYVTTSGWGLLGVDASFLWHTRLAPRLDMRYGAGIGIGVLVGELNREETICPAGTTVEDLDNPNVCTLSGRKKEPNDGVPPVVPIVNILLGLRFQVNPQLTLNLEGGFRDMFFLGLGAEYTF